MEDYIVNIATCAYGLMHKDDTIATPEQALAILVGRAAARRYVLGRKASEEAAKFVCTALDKYSDYDYELRKCIEKLDSELFVNAIACNEWQALDVALYCMICVLEKDEIIRRLKDLEK